MRKTEKERSCRPQKLELFGKEQKIEKKVYIVLKVAKFLLIFCEISLLALPKTNIIAN